MHREDQCNDTVFIYIRLDDRIPKARVMRKRIGKASGWLKVAAGMPQTQHPDPACISYMIRLKAAAQDPARLCKLLATGIRPSSGPSASQGLWRSISTPQLLFEPSKIRTKTEIPNRPTPLLATWRRS